MAALICILCGLPKGDRVASSKFLKSTSRRYRNSKKTLYGPYCKVVQKSGVWQPDYSDLFVENREFFYTPLVFSAPTGGDPVGISWRCLMLVKLEWLGYSMVKKLWRYVKPFSSDTGTLRTDRQTDRFAISISRVSMLTRDKNCTNNRFDLCKSLHNWVMNTHTNHSAGLILPARAKIHL